MARKKKKPTSRKGTKKKRSVKKSGTDAAAGATEAGTAAEATIPTASPEEATVAPVVLEDDVPVIDLDADTEEDDAVEQLIAEALATEASAARPLIDLGPGSSPEVRDRLLAEALAHAEHKDARYRVPFSGATAIGRWKALAGILILLLAGVVALTPPGWARPERPARLAPAERERNLRAALLLQAQQIEAFRVRAQRLPASLDEVAGTLPDVRYVRSGSRAYQLIAYEADGSAIVYDSTDPAPAFAELATPWAPSSIEP